MNNAIIAAVPSSYCLAAISVCSCLKVCTRAASGLSLEWRACVKYTPQLDAENSAARLPAWPSNKAIKCPLPTPLKLN